ncbi:lipopolysaccharide biosynthesis protein [Acinetobacter sp. HC8-3S]
MYFNTFCYFCFVNIFKFSYIKRRKKESISEYVKYGWIPTFSALLILLNAQFDRIILSSVVDNKALGYYTISQSFTALITYISISVMVVITPKLIKLYQEKEFSELYLLSRKYSILLFSISSIILVLTVLFGDFFFALYGVKSQEGYFSLLILLFGVALSQIFGFGMTIAAYTEDKSKLLFFQVMVLLLFQSLVILCL